MDIPSIQKNIALEKMIEEFFSEELSRTCHNSSREATLGELFSGRLRDFVAALCFLAVYVAYFRESICAMAIILSLPHDIARKYIGRIIFWLDYAKLA